MAIRPPVPLQHANLFGKMHFAFGPLGTQHALTVAQINPCTRIPDAMPTAYFTNEPRDTFRQGPSALGLDISLAVGTGASQPLMEQGRGYYGEGSGLELPVRFYKRIAARATIKNAVQMAMDEAYAKSFDAVIIPPMGLGKIGTTALARTIAGAVKSCWMGSPDYQIHDVIIGINASDAGQFDAFSKAALAVFGGEVDVADCMALRATVSGLLERYKSGYSEAGADLESFARKHPQFFSRSDIALLEELLYAQPQAAPTSFTILGNLSQAGYPPVALMAAMVLADFGLTYGENG